MCEPTMGACECASETTTTTRRRGLESRPCECGNACGRTASGGHRLSRTCRAEAPWRAKVAGLMSAMRAGGLDELDDDQVIGCVRARMLLWDDNAQRMSGEILRRIAAEAERDELTAALQVARDHERGQAVRLQRAKAERDDWKYVAEKNAEERGQAHMELASLESLYGGAGRRNKNLTTRLRIAWGVIGLLCVALGVVGVVG